MNKVNCCIMEIRFHRFQQTGMSVCRAQKRQNARIFDQVVWGISRFKTPQNATTIKSMK